jgi:hypothetical protein
MTALIHANEDRVRILGIIDWQGIERWVCLILQRARRGFGARRFVARKLKDSAQRGGRQRALTLHPVSSIITP